MISLFCGYDPRESVGFHVFAHSVLERASTPVAFIPLAANGLQQGSNAFTASRFLIPYLMGYTGRAIFADASDMLMLGDVADLDALFDPLLAVQVVKHPNYQSRHPVKYRGTAMECPNTSYPMKNWASLMQINCGHPVWQMLNPESIARAELIDLLQFSDLDPSAIGELPDRWNRLVDEGQDAEGASLLHWTAGVPGFEQYRDAPGAEHWHAARAAMEQTA